jgi:TonB-dependent receptor
MERSYHDYFPSIHLRYEVTESLQARVSYSTGAARPNMSDLYPITTVSHNDTTGFGTVTSSNPGLRPQFSKNEDVSLEWYFEPAGVLSAGWFRKKISDYLNRSIEDVDFGPDNGFNGLYEGYTLNTTTNLNAAQIEGWEFNYNQRLVMLPKPFNGLRVFGTFTKLKTEGKYSLGVSELTNFVPETANAGLSMLWRKLEAGFTYNYTSEYLTTASANVNTRRTRTAVDTINLNFIYSIRPQLGVFFDVINVGDEWPATFTGTDQRRVVISEAYGRRINLGITGRF